MSAMETNGDNFVDQQLLQQFRCMGTTDKDELVKQLKMLVGNHIPTASAKFLLDMNDWNLQAAVGSYFDIEMPRKVLSMTFVRHENDSNIFRMSPSSSVSKMWQLLNNGDETWPDGCCLQFCGGDVMCVLEKIPLPPLAPNDAVSIIMNFVSPAAPGVYKSEWRMITSAGAYFGEIIWVIMTVEEDTSNLAKQLSDLHTSVDDSSNFNQPNVLNPFGGLQ